MAENDPKSKGEKNTEVVQEKVYIPESDLEAESLKEALLDNMPGGFDWKLRMEMSEDDLSDRSKKKSRVES